MKKLSSKILFTKPRKEMWKDTSKIIRKIDATLDLKEIYVIGSLVSKNKKINDIDFLLGCHTPQFHCDINPKQD